MKNIVTGLFLAISLVSCQTVEKDVDVESNVMLPEPVPKENLASGPLNEGLALIEGADCLTCHKMDSKLVGPSYQDVAAKYTVADIPVLAKKIIEGGKGVWGEVPMSAHAGMSSQNAEKMVSYILTLKK